MKNLVTRVLLPTLLALLAPGPAGAAVTYDLLADPLNTTTFRVYVTETLTGPSTSLAGAGLDGGGFAVQLKSGAGVRVADLGFNPTFNAGAPFNTKSVSDASAKLTESTAPDSPAVPFVEGRALLGTMTFAAVGASGGTATFTLARYGVGGDIVTRDGLSIDDAPPTPGQYTPVSPVDFDVTIVPEPAAAGMSVVALGFLLTHRRARA